MGSLNYIPFKNTYKSGFALVDEFNFRAIKYGKSVT